MLKLARAGVVAGLSAAVVLSGVSAAAPGPRSTPLRFDPPVLLTPTTGFGGHEPSLAIDAHDNVWVTAHRPYLPPAAPDAGARTGARTAAWLWVSPDGKTFGTPPGLNDLKTHELQFGLEGDIATDAAGNVHYVDLGPASTTYTHWKSAGKGKYAAVRSTPNSGAFTYDRPFVAANGQIVIVAVNDLGTYPLTPTDSDVVGGKAPGSYGLYVSRDGGATFPLNGYRAGESLICRPHVGRQNPKLLLAACSANLLDGLTDDLGDDGMLVFVSHDEGRTWSKQLLLDTGATPSENVSFPSVAETRDGSLHFLFHRTAEGVPESHFQSDLLLSSSHDDGRTWSRPRRISPEPGQWLLASIAADPRTGRLGLAGFHRKKATDAWDFRAAVFAPGSLDLVSHPVPGGEDAYPASSTPAGEFTQAAFDSRGRLNVVFTVQETAELGPASNESRMVPNSQVFYARTR